ncbi:hypothetical protein KSP35_07000 [Aquihabitans sp. G128]|uniref:hypothetical protein n=1 Tax=Aquihabitans sp. G128 TaxID=2849779 RepID=UPI001C2280D8|nr:hypothetical protein [Aquihabitans sp. G128]QXC62539.1 hypothetical protein KSP35_07000 [Aquihabitans sp. G128]
MTTKSVEDGIRHYLETLGQSGRPVVDRGAVEALRSQIKAETDVIVRLKLTAALTEAQEGQAPDFSRQRAVFISEAKAYAEAENIPAAAWLAVGVPEEVLKEAGIEVPAAASKGRAKAASGGGGARAPRIPYEDVKKAAHKLGSGWKVADLATALDREKGTATNYVKQLLENGDIVDLGDAPDHDGRGRAPKLYGKA